MFKPRIERKAEITVVGLVGKFTMQNNTISSLWTEFNKRDKEITNAVSDVAIGVCFYDKDHTNESAFTYLAGKIVDSDYAMPSGMSSRKIPAADYAVFEHKGALDTLRETYNQIFEEWLPQSGYEFGNQDDLEIYGDKFAYGKRDSIMEIWIPVKK